MKFIRNIIYPLFSKSSPVKQTPQISWSTWDDKKSDDEESDLPPLSHNENIPQPSFPSKQTFNWHSLIKSANENSQINNQTKDPETMPKFDFDDNSFDTLFNNSDE